MWHFLYPVGRNEHQLVTKDATISRDKLSISLLFSCFNFETKSTWESWIISQCCEVFQIQSVLYVVEGSSKLVLLRNTLGQMENTEWDEKSIKYLLLTLTLSLCWSQVNGEYVSKNNSLTTL